jgi:hypothetical protein
MVLFILPMKEVILELRNKSRKLEYVLSFKMGWRILVFYREQQ